MKYNFADEVRHALAGARDEAIALRHDYVGTEHILLGLISLPDSAAGRVLDRLGVRPAIIRTRVRQSIRPGNSPGNPGELPYTSRARKVLEYAMSEAGEMHDGYVGAEHLLLGLLREEKAMAAQVLNSVGVTIEKVSTALGRPAGSGPRPQPVSLAEAVRSPSEEEPVWFVEIDAESASPIYEQIIARVEEAVATGRLQPGERLPTVRELAEELDVAPGTVARAYTELGRKGILETEGARGTRVTDRAPSEGAPSPNGEHDDALESLLRTVVVAAFHMGVSARRLRDALERAMKGILGDSPTTGG